MVWGIFFPRWLFMLSSNLYKSKGQIQDYICYRLGGFIWKVMSFGVKNGPPTYKKVVTKTFKEYLEFFMKIFLNGFIVYNDMESHLQKLTLYFQKCKEYGINMKLDKCAFMVFSRMVLGFIVSKKRKLLDPMKIQTIVNMPPPKNPR